MTVTCSGSPRGVGGLQLPLPHPETQHLLQVPEGGGMWVSNALLVWSILTLVVVVVACSITILFFRPKGIYIYPVFRWVL